MIFHFWAVLISFLARGRDLHSWKFVVKKRATEAYAVLFKMVSGVMCTFVFLTSVQAMQVTDDRGVTAHFTVVPRRIVSLLPSLTEIVCALQACAQLVGVDSYSNWPLSVQTLPKVGGLDNTQIERIVALRPDVVLVAQSSRATSRLAALGLQVVALEPHTQADVRRTLNVLAVLLGVPHAETVAQRLWQGWNAQIEQVSTHLAPKYKGRTVYFEVGSGPYAAGESSFIGQIMMRLGLRNVITAPLGAFPQVNPEWVVRENPYYIMTSENNANAMRQRPGWQSIRAVRENHICAFTAAQVDVLLRPGVRMGEAAQLISACVQGF